MSDLKLFLKSNQEQRENVKYAVTETIKDGDGKAVEWELRHLTQDEVDEIRASCTREVPDNIKKGSYRQKTDSNKLMCKMLTASVVYPDLNNKELQDSYGVYTPEELLKKLVYSPGEYNSFGEFFNKMNNFNKSFDEEVELAKN